MKLEFGNELDLHHFHPADTKTVVLEFIDESVKEGLEKVRIIHGKGKSVKKKTVYSLLSDHPSVVSFKDDGPNWGSTVVYLKIE